MSDLIMLILAGMGGLLLGFFFYGGLWLTVKKMNDFNNPAFLFLGSMLGRIALTMLGFYYISQGNVFGILVCLVGFILARIVVTRLTSKPVVHEN
jgi:F1F0 ATPase subunit 2